MKEHIAEIILNCKYGDENLLTDYDTAAVRILDYLDSIDMLVKPVPVIELVAA